MIPIPKYLKEVSEFVSTKNEKLTFKIKCKCSSIDFWIYKNIPIVKGDKKLIQATKEWYEKNTLLFPNPPTLKERNSANYFCWKTEVIKEGWYIRIYRAKDMPYREPLEDAIPVHTWFFKNDEIPLCPSDPRFHMTDYNKIFKIKCASCGEEYLLFDSRIHGNDAADFLPEILDKLDEYKFKQRQLKGSDDNKAKIQVTVTNYWDFDDISINGNEGLTVDDYSNMFSHIIIKAIISDKKSIAICSEELG